MQLMRLPIMMIRVYLVKMSSQLHTPTAKLMYIHIVMHKSHLKMFQLSAGIQDMITPMATHISLYYMNRYNMANI